MRLRPSLLILVLLLAACEKTGIVNQRRQPANGTSGKDLTTASREAEKTADSQGTAAGASNKEQPATVQNIPASRLSWDGMSLQGNNTLNVMSVE